MTFWLLNLSLEMRETIMVLSEAMLMFLKIYNLLITLRLTLVWFPNFNPYIQPFVFLLKFVDPFLRIFRGFLPSVFGIDFSPLLALTFLQALSEFLQNLRLL